MTERKPSNPWRTFSEICFFSVMAVVGGSMAYWVLDDQLPYDYHHVGAEITPNPASQGGRVTVRWPITIHRLCPGVVHRSLRNAITNAPLAQYDPTPSALSVRHGDHALLKTFDLPSELPPLVKYDATVCFKCNPLQVFFPICTTTPALIFRVEPEAEKTSGKAKNDQ